MAHFLPPEHVRQVNKLEWPKLIVAQRPSIDCCALGLQSLDNPAPVCGSSLKMWDTVYIILSKKSRTVSHQPIKPSRYFVNVLFFNDFI